MHHVARIILISGNRFSEARTYLSVSVYYTHILWWLRYRRQQPGYNECYRDFEFVRPTPPGLRMTGRAEEQPGSSEKPRVSLKLSHLHKTVLNIAASIYYAEPNRFLTSSSAIPYNNIPIILYVCARLGKKKKTFSVNNNYILVFNCGLTAFV